MPNDPYILEELIACGPSAKVYRGHDLSSKKTVRLKVLMDIHVSCPVDHTAIESLAPRLLSLRHVNVSTLRELNVHGGDVTLVTEFEAGVNLWMFLRQQRFLSAWDAKSLAAQLMMALGAGEALELHHGDIKPSNVIVIASPAGAGCTLRLQDWGEAACRSHQPAETLNYRAPELLPGGEATSAGDLFSVGATLATLLLGHAPVYGGSPTQLLAEWAAFDPIVLRQRRPDLEPAFHDWLAWLLCYDPAHRPQSAQQALEVLQQPVEHAAAVSVQVPPPTLSSIHDQPTTQLSWCETKSSKGSKATKTPKSGTWQRVWHVTMALVFSFTALAVIAGYFAWLAQRGEATWPKQLQRILVEKLDSWSALKR